LICAFDSPFSPPPFFAIRFARSPPRHFHARVTLSPADIISICFLRAAGDCADADAAISAIFSLSFDAAFQFSPPPIFFMPFISYSLISSMPLHDFISADAIATFQPWSRRLHYFRHADYFDASHDAMSAFCRRCRRFAAALPFTMLMPDFSRMPYFASHREPVFHYAFAISFTHSSISLSPAAIDIAAIIFSCALRRQAISLL